MRRKCLWIGAISGILLLIVTLKVVRYQQEPISTGEGWINVCGKYEQEGTCYVVIPTAAHGKVPMEIDQEIYEQVVCSEEVLYHIKYAYYDPPGEGKLILLDLNDVLDSRSEEEK